MQPGSREPENYSIDDMMERLKRKPESGDDDNGQLVTRPDGSQAIRVRKRKRRSRQPIKEREKRERKRRFAQILALMVFILVLTGIFAGGIIYSNSSPFRAALVEKITATTGAETELRQFRMNPTSANADRLNLEWPAGNPIESLQVRGIRAESSITSIFGRSFQGSEIQAREGTLVLRVPDGSQPRAVPTEGNDPGVIDFQRVSVDILHIMPGEGMPRILRLRDTEASFYPNRGGGTPQMRLNGGDIRAPGLPELQLDRALAEFNGGDIHLAAARMFHGDDTHGEFVIAGEIRTSDASSTAILETAMESFLIEGILGERMARLFSGRIDSAEDEEPNTLTFPVADPEQGELRTAFTSSINQPFLIHGFNFLSELSVLLDDAWFEQPYFEDGVTGTIHRKGGDVHIRGLHAENRNRMAIRGDLTLSSSRRLAGNLEIGIPNTIVSSAPNPTLDQAIPEASGGYRWISIEIGGNFDSPTDNLRSVIENSASTGVTPPGTPESSEGATFEDLTAPR